MPSSLSVHRFQCGRRTPGQKKDPGQQIATPCSRAQAAPYRAADHRRKRQQGQKGRQQASEHR
ncbi:MAG TPA: hypothetical protein VGF67_03545 [Ktedonobacteraceae bacterium]